MDRILILRTGSTAPAVLRDHGDYDRWFIDAMERHDLAFDVCDVTNELPPDMTGCSGIIVTGATSAAFRPEPWMASLSEFLRRAEHAGPPVLCVCLGVQLLAQARGGQVVLNPAGWEIGSVRVRLTEQGRVDPLFEGLSDDILVLATHEDRVEALPPGAVLLGGNRITPVQAFRAAEGVWGVQFHPELSARVLRRLIQLRRETLTTEARQRKREDPGGYVDRLLDRLDERDEVAGRRVLDNFVRLCRQKKDPTAAVVR